MRLFLIILFFISSLQALEQKSILLLHSYNSGLKWSDGITEGIEEGLKDNLLYELSIEYMDSKKIDTKEYFNTLKELYKKKFSTRKYDIIIAADNYAYNFVLENHEEIFNKTAVVFCGVENFKQKDIPSYLKPYVTGVVEYKEIKRNIEFIKDAIKDLSTLYIISDSSFSSSAIKKQILDATLEFKDDFKIIFNDKIDLEELRKDIYNLPSNSAILFTSLYIDKYGRYIPYNNIRKLFKESKYPVFAVNKIHLGEGVVGGIMVSPQEQGLLAINKAIEIIKGKKIQTLSIDMPSSKYYFDYQVMEKYAIDKSKIPMFSTIVNKPQNFFEKNRQIIDSTFVLIPFLVLLIIGLIVNIVKRIKLEIKLVEQTKLDNVLLNNIKSAIYWQSNEGILLGCNDSLCKLLSVAKRDIIGKEMQKVLPQLYEQVKGFDNFLCDEIEVKIKINKRNLHLFIRRKVYFDKNNNEAGIVTILSDITKMRTLEIQRKKDEQFLIQRSKLSEVGEMITSIAHQWKTPLIEISTIAQELLHKRKKSELSENETQEFVEEIMTQVHYMTETIDDFKAFIKPSTEKKDFAVQEAIKELLNVIEHNIKYNYITVKINFEKDKELKINGYQNEFKQSILNIINNAKDSINKKREKKNIDGLITIDIYSENNKVYILIKDNGVGIKKENLDLIFEPFYTDKKNGDGFGLYMAKLIIEDKMQGHIEALECKEGAQILIAIKSTTSKEGDYESSIIGG
ncbi:histidine kinase [Malaciobacter mytili LMG 24559]|uniref:histidine kinase n=2 Tax=Malaciobacter mytili TaxID=603050 RepID=A0AAX2AFF1_9BACT|nr:ABC transporter substrate binding protein [Malaciobacter mytili]AXH16091.1 two-component system sensor histidine kinase [Malaciobacter mytili LMG 24559]RXK14931.1 histidine kinase [Malaciobacter mytili LMG 24559]